MRSIGQFCHCFWSCCRWHHRCKFCLGCWYWYWYWFLSLCLSRDHRTHCWKGANQGPFHQSLVAIDPVVSEEKIKMTYGRTTAKSDGNSSYDLTAKSDRKNIRIPQPLIVIGHLHISDFDSKIMRFSGVIYLEGGQYSPISCKV